MLFILNLNNSLYINQRGEWRGFNRHVLFCTIGKNISRKGRGLQFCHLSESNIKIKKCWLHRAAAMRPIDVVAAHHYIYLFCVSEQRNTTTYNITLNMAVVKRSSSINENQKAVIIDDFSCFSNHTLRHALNGNNTLAQTFRRIKNFKTNSLLNLKAITWNQEYI